jgi:hypothetical protein
MLEKHLEQLGKELGIAILPPDPQNLRALKIGEIGLTMKELDPGIYFQAPVAPLPKQKREELLMLLMKANFLGQGTGGSALGLKEDESFLTLSLALPYEMNYKTFREAVEDFVNYVDYWKNRVAEAGKS